VTPRRGRPVRRLNRPLVRERHVGSLPRAGREGEGPTGRAPLASGAEWPAAHSNERLMVTLLHAGGQALRDRRRVGWMTRVSAPNQISHLAQAT